MMICIDLDNEDDDVVMVDNKVENTNILKKKFIFKRKLVLAVRKHRALYDNEHKFFTNVAKKELIWQQIAKHLKTDVDVCKQTWIELRYSYQCYARRLQNYFLTGHKKNRKRPAMGLELELMFLWRFIENRKTSNLPFDISDVIEEAEEELVQQSNETEIQIEMDIESADQENKNGIEDANKDNNSTAIYKEIDEDLILIEEPVELIVIDEDDDNGKSEKQFKISDSMKKLVQQIKTYPELYDSDNSVYHDYSHRSNIWNSIATFLGDKATKLMKCWIIMQTRYEWEIMHMNKDNVDSTPSELQKELEFLKCHILKNPDTVYKQSYYLKTQWYDAIDYFKEIYNLIVRMKKTSEVVYITDSLLKSKEKNKQYLTLWSEIATSKGCSAGQCEVTWLIMRYFYWELMSMRQQKYKLTDKWYFETIITELYAISKVTQKVRQHEEEVRKTKKPYKISSKSYSVSGSNSKSRNATTTTETTVLQNNSTVTTAPITATNNLQSLPVTSSAITTTSAATLSLPLPKITGAISLAPQMLNNGSLQIKQISGPPCLNINQSVNGTISTSRVSSMPATLIQQQQAQSQTSMQMPYNLPNQLKVTTVPLSTNSIPAIRPLMATSTQSSIGSTASTLISIRTKATASAPTQIAQNKMNFMPTLTPPTMQQSTVRPIMTSSLQSFRPATIQQPTVQPIMTAAVQTSAATSRASVIPPTQPTTSFAVSTIAPVPPLSMITNSTAPSAVNRNITTVSTSIPTPTSSSSSTSTANDSQMPKITGAASLLNPNEVLIELIASQNGNHLVVHGPALTTKYQLPMPTVARFIREVLGVPLLHNKRVSQPVIVNNYWEQIAKKFNLPVHICRACWNFLLENFNHFPQIAPLKEVMRPFPTTINVWMESTVLFQKFDEHCLAMGWNEYMSCIPEVVECIGGYPVLYQDVSKDNNKQSDMEALCAWRTINLRYPKIPPLKEIWKSIKICFCQYMSDIELSIENKWSRNWWRAFARLKFLVEAKYSTNEPFYYIVSNKIVEEIERCAMLEMKERFIKDKTVEETPVKSDNKEPKSEPEPEPTEIPATPAPTEDLVVKKDIELGTLLTAMQKHPAIFEKTNSEAKYEAWKQVAKDLHMEVIDCLMSFKKATKMYYAFKKQDPVNNCRLNEKYYKKLDKIIRTISSNKASSNRCSTINIKTPFELNQSLESSSTCSDYVFPERFIPEISMTNSPSNLVVKNWIYAFGNRNLNDAVKGKLQKVLKKYIKNVDDHQS